MTRLALLKMYGAAPGNQLPVSLPNLPPLPGLPADILQQAQQQQDKALNLHLQRQKELEAKDERLRGESDDDDTKEAVDDEDLNIGKSDGGSMQNSLSPPLPPSSGKKRHLSSDSIEPEEVPSPKKHAGNPLGLPGINLRIANRGKFDLHSKVHVVKESSNMSRTFFYYSDFIFSI